MTEELEDYRELLQINKYNLDEHLTQQADVYYRVSEGYANAVSRRDQAKEDLAREDADIAHQLRREAEREGAKLTEAKLAQAVLLDERHDEAHKKLSKAKNEADHWGILKDSFVQRASMLKELAGLYCAGYYVDEAFKDNTATKEIRSDINKKKVAEKRAEKRRKWRSRDE